MLKKHSLLFLAMLSSASLYANVPIESRGLSQSGSAAASAGNDQPVATNLNWQIMQKNQQLENDIRALRGKMEEQEYAIEQLKKELTNRYTDLDQRMELLTQKVDPDSAVSTDENSADTNNPNNSAPTPPSATPATTDTTSPVAPTPSTNDTANPSTSNVTTPAGNNASDLEKAAYTVALDAYKQGGAKKAIAPMENFIKNHPDSIYTPNAYFWLAEFNLATEPVNYAQAKQNYQIVLDRYPTSNRAPRSLYQLYSIAKEVDKKNDIAEQYKNRLLANYPQSEEAGFVKK